MSKKTLKNKILLVDDETDFLEIMGDNIESWGYQVIKASDGGSAMKAISDDRPDVVVLDYVMPDMNGIELLKKIRGVNSSIPVIMFTAKPDTGVIKESAELDITAFVPKLSPYVDTKKSLRSALNMAFKKL
ncbi:MAG: response regulator [Candidatus Omnitrophota bacterium]